MDGIKGKVAVVTGAAQGNGRAIAEGLARHGAKVALADIQEAVVERAANDLRAEGLDATAWRLDVADPQSVSALASAVKRELGPAEILVNNAGILRRSDIRSESFETDWQALMEINGTGTILMVRTFLDQLQQTRGRIVNLGSIMSVRGGPGLVGYAASKGAVLQLTRALAHELAPDGIRVNAIAPGVIETAMTIPARNNPEVMARYMAHIPQGRLGQPEELAGPVLFLASHLSSYVTGTLLPVDGGYLAA